MSTISIDQHGFFTGPSTVTSIFDLISYVYKYFDSKLQVDVVFTNFSKAFDSIDHNTLAYILDLLSLSYPR